MSLHEPGPEGAGAASVRPEQPINLLDRVSHWMMIVSALTLLLMTFIVSFEVASRYLLGAPTIWAWDVNVQLMVLMIMFGLGEVYRRGDYVRVDVIIGSLSPRSRALLDILFAPLLLFITVVIIWTSWNYFHQAWMRNQAASTIFAPPLWPIKFVLPLGGLMLLAQGILKLIQDIRLFAISGGNPESSSTAGKDFP